MRRPLVISVAALALVVGATAGCGGGSTVTKTLTTSSTPTSAPVTTAGVTTPPPPTAPTAALGADQLPPEDAIAGVRSGTITQLDDPTTFVDALYQSGDPTKPAAVTRLTAAGYAAGALRDQVGEDTASGIALFRTYVFQLGDEAKARAEVSDSVEEVRQSTSQPTKNLDLSGIPGAQGLHVDIEQGNITGAVTFVTFPAGPYVYGLQGVSTASAALPEKEIIGAARDLYEKVTAAP